MNAMKLLFHKKEYDAVHKLAKAYVHSKRMRDPIAYSFLHEIDHMQAAEKGLPERSHEESLDYALELCVNILDGWDVWLKFDK